jgi:hypothetical protein
MDVDSHHRVDTAFAGAATDIKLLGFREFVTHLVVRGIGPHAHASRVKAD